MDVFNQNLYIKIIKIILHRFEKKGRDEFIFLGDIEDNIKEIIDKIISNKNLTETDKKKLEITYGNDYKNIKNLINKNTELIYESIFPDDNIQTLKKKIFLNLSNKKEEYALFPENQYFFIKHNIDRKFYLELINNLFLDDNTLDKDIIEDELEKVLNKKINLKKLKYDCNSLKIELLDIFKTSATFTYDLPLSIRILNKSNNLLVCEYADIIKNNDIDNDFNDRLETNDFTLLNNYQINNNTIYLYDKYDYVSNNDEFENYILERYWLDNNTIRYSNLLFDKLNDEYNDSIKKINLKYQNLLGSYQNEISQDLKNYNINNKIFGITFLYEPIVKLDINLGKLLNLIKLDNDIPYLYYLGKKKRGSKLKLYEPLYYGDNAKISKDQLKEWTDYVFTNLEKNNYDKNNFLIFKILINEDYFTLYLNKEGKILGRINSTKEKLIELDLSKLLNTINTKLFSRINEIISRNEIFQLHNLDTKNIKILHLNGAKILDFNKIISSNVLKKLIDHYNEFLFFKNKQLLDNYDNGLKKKKNNYSIKRVNDFGSIASVEKFVSRMIIDSNNRLNKKELELKISRSFNISISEATTIYSNFIKGIMDQTNKEDNGVKGNIIGTLKKNIKKIDETIILQYYDLRDKIIFNFSFVKSFEELMFLNNLLNTIYLEFLMNKVYKETKEIKDLKVSEKKLENLFNEEIVKVEKKFGSLPSKRRIVLNDSNTDNNSNSDNNSNNNSNNNNSNNNNSNNNNNSEENSLDILLGKTKQKPKSVYGKKPLLINELNKEEIINLQGNQNNQNNENQNNNENNQNQNNNNVRDVEELEFDNLKEYFTELRAKYDPELFSSGRKSKIASKQKDKKGSTAKIDYTTRCQSVNDKFPIIISKNKLKEIQENPKYLEGLDVFFFEDKKSKKYEKATYFLEGGKNNKNIYICPRIWCVKCEIPISPIDFSKKEFCPKCKGGIIKDKKEKITNDNTVYVRKHSTTWKDTSQTSFLKKYIEIKGEENLKIPESLNLSQKGMFPYYIKPIEADNKIKLICCGSKTKKLKEKVDPESINNKNNKLNITKKSLIKHKFSFLTKKDKLEEFRMGIPYKDINILLENSHVIELKDYKKTETELYKYYFKFLGKLREYKTDEGINNRKKYVRMGVINENYFPNNSFICCLNTLIFVDNTNSNISETQQNYILDFINDVKKFTPILFIQMLGGNLIELFREQNMKLNKKLEDKLTEFFQYYKKDFNSLGISLGDTRELFNIYSAMNNFREYSNNSGIRKKFGYYLDLITQDNFLFKQGRNIVILEKSDKNEKSKTSILCHNSNNYGNNNRDCYLLLKIGNYYEPLIMFEFRGKKQEAKDVYVRHNNRIVKSLLKIQQKTCNQITNLPIDVMSEIKYFIKGYYPKIIGLVLKNDVFVKINAINIQSEHLGKIVNIKNIDKDKLKEFDKKNVSNKIFELLKPLIDKNKSLDDLNELIYNEIMDKDERVIYFRNYYNNVCELNNVIFNLNKFFTFDKSNNEIVLKIGMVLKNPVYSLKIKKNKIKEIFVKNKIFEILFNFTNKDYFVNKVELKNYYSNLKKIDISKKNLINSKENKESILNLLIEKMVRDKRFGIKLITEEIDEYNFKSLSSLDKKQQLEVGFDSIDKAMDKLFLRKKIKHIRNVNTINTKKRIKEISFVNNLNNLQNNSSNNSNNVDVKLIKKKNKKKES
jgi:hypothetical protein